MNYLLHINTALEKGSVCLSGNGELLQQLTSEIQKEHASFIQPAIDKILKQQKITPRELSAVAIIAGPGSYTGLRIGMATAKGLCYALRLPLITISTFEVMTIAANEYLNTNNTIIASTDLFCPMIDARRMEVYTALLNRQIKFVKESFSEIITPATLKGQLNACKIFFFGSGASKFKSVCHHENAVFIEIDFTASNMISLSHQRFTEKNFASLAYTEPFYGKEFYFPAH
jgi:tRNA threonylcarbamoyladenosine biosynthesis protein TsaB